MRSSKIKKNSLSILILIFTLIFNTLVYAGDIVNINLVYDGVSHKYSAQEVKISVDGKMITNYNVPPVIIDSRTLVPARAVFETMGAEVNWNDSTKEVYITKDNNIVILKINDSNGISNGETFTMDVPAKIINGSTMIPVRAVSEAFDCVVGWNNETRIVTISTGLGEDVATPSDNVNSGGTSSTAEVNVTSVTVPQSNNDIQSFTINTSGEIGKYNSFTLDGNRLVVDVYNANMSIPNTDITVSTSPFVTKIRSAQNQITPEKITRIVLDLTSGLDYNINLSADKKSIIISFSENTIRDISLDSSSGIDYLRIKGDISAPAVTVTRMNNPSRVVVDIPYSRLDFDTNSISNNTLFIDSIRSSQFEEKTVRIVLDVSMNVDTAITQNGNITTVEIYKSTVENISYDYSSHTLILEKNPSINISQITHTDDYMNGKYIFTLPGNFKDTFGYGKFSIGDNFLSNLEIQNNSNNQTVLTLNENSIIAVSVVDMGNSIHIKIMNPKDKYSKIVAIDAGHGLQDPGTSGNGLVEKDVNLDILLRLKKLLDNNSDIKVYYTRTSDTYPTNPERAQMANEVADLFISIHQNSAAPNEAPNGTESLYMVRANETSGKLTSKIAAQFVQQYMVAALDTTDRGIKERPDLIVLNQTKIPTVLIETLFLSNKEDAAKMSQDSYKDAAAQALYSAIVDMLNQYEYR